MLGLVGRQARTGAAPLVPGQLEPWTALAGHAHFGRLLADVGAAVLFIHTVEALWDTERGREVHTMKLSYSGREAGYTQRGQHMLKDQAGVAGDCSRTFRGSKSSTTAETFLWVSSEKKFPLAWQMQKLTPCKRPCLNNAPNKACKL